MSDRRPTWMSSHRAGAQAPEGPLTETDPMLPAGSPAAQPPADSTSSTESHGGATAVAPPERASQAPIGPVERADPWPTAPLEAAGTVPLGGTPAELVERWSRDALGSLGLSPDRPLGAQIRAEIAELLRDDPLLERLTDDRSVAGLGPRSSAPE